MRKAQASGQERKESLPVAAGARARSSSRGARLGGRPGSRTRARHERKGANMSTRVPPSKPPTKTRSTSSSCRGLCIKSQKKSRAEGTAGDKGKRPRVRAGACIIDEEEKGSENEGAERVHKSPKAAKE